MSIDFFLGAMAGIGLSLIASWAWDRSRRPATPTADERDSDEPLDPTIEAKYRAQADAILRRGIYRGSGGV